MAASTPASHPRIGHAVALTLIAGVCLRFAVELTPSWWMAWLAPIPLLLLAFSQPRGRARLAVFIAALIANSANVHYFSLVMPWPAVGVVLALQSLLWVFVVMTTRHVVVRYRSPWSVLAYPTLWVAVDTLLARLAPDGNWGSLAYSQADVLPLLQITSLFGVAGLLFLLCLLPSTIAVLGWRRSRLRRAGWPLGLTALALVAALGFGWLRLQAPIVGTPMRIGMAAIDDPIGPAASPAYRDTIRAAYDALIERLAAQGAALIVLPEKVAVLDPDLAAQWQSHFAAQAARHKVWIEIGIGILEGGQPHNVAWLFDPAGRAVTQYEKQILAPPERAQGYARGHAFDLQTIADNTFGLAICKDMHFASLGRAYGQRGADVMLVPAWDFAYLDGWLEARTTVVRGVESGYAVIRAAREGLLTASDAHGRVLAETASSPLPGSLLIADVPLGERLPTLYTRIGNLLGWLCVGVVLAGAAFGCWRGLRSTRSSSMRSV